MAVLSHKQILSLHAAVVATQLTSSRAALLGGIDPAFADSLPICANPSSQILSDLHVLNANARLGDGTFPFTIWLANAQALVSSRSEAKVFDSALAAAESTGGDTLAMPAQQRGTIDEELSRIGRAVFLARGDDLERCLYEVETLLSMFPYHVEARLLRDRISRAIGPELRAHAYLLSWSSASMPSASDVDWVTRRAVGRVESKIEPFPTLSLSSASCARRKNLFIGRERELSELTNQIGTGGLLITGLAGVGKVALSRKLLQALAPRYPDLQISMDLEWVNRERPFSIAVMEKVVRAFLPTVALPKRASEIANYYRAVLQGQRALILLENVQDGNQVEPLLPPAGSVLLITSRSRFTLPGIHTLTLDRLEGNDARALLHALAPQLDDDVSGNLAELCGGLPFVLHLAGGALAMRPDISPKMYADRLQDSQARHEQIDAVLSVSFDLLDHILQVIWSHLGLLESYFGVSSATAVTGLGLLESYFSVGSATAVTGGWFSRISEALVDLVAYGLLDHDSDTDFYTMPRAARRFARSRLSEEDRVKAERRCESLSSIDRDERRAVGSRGLESALGAARRAGHREAEAIYLTQLSGSDNLRSVEYAEQSLALFRELGDREGALRPLAHMMAFYSNVNDVRRCLAICDQRLDCISFVDDKYQQVRLLYFLSQDYEQLGERDKAIAAAQRGVDINRELPDALSKRCENQLSRLHALLKP